MQRPAFWRVPRNKPDADERHYVSKSRLCLLGAAGEGRGGVGSISSWDFCDSIVSALSGGTEEE
jgi:hypothetical protein